MKFRCSCWVETTSRPKHVSLLHDINYIQYNLVLLWLYSLKDIISSCYAVVSMLSLYSPLRCKSCIVDRDLKWWLSICYFCGRQWNNALQSSEQSTVKKFFAIFIFVCTTDLVLWAIFSYSPSRPLGEGALSSGLSETDKSTLRLTWSSRRQTTNRNLVFHL